MIIFCYRLLERCHPSDEKSKFYRISSEDHLAYPVAAEHSKPLPNLVSREVELYIFLVVGQYLIKPSLNGLMRLHLHYLFEPDHITFHDFRSD